MLALAFLAASYFWQNPGRVEAADLTIASGPPKPPYIFLREETYGTSPKVLIRDAAGTEWRVKGGHDVIPEAFITRFISALGYYAETTYFFPKGRIEHVGPLKRASGFIQPDGSFTYASFEKVEPGSTFLGSWSYIDPALKNTKELKGLKILVMLFSNWDNKDSRNETKGSNTSILQLRNGRRVYFVNDWGQSFGAWGRMFGRENWRCGPYENQTRYFITGVKDNFVQFGYGGEHTNDFRTDITVDDVRWLMTYLGRITDTQIHSGFKAAGASPDEVDCFSRALRGRIEQLRKITLK